MTQRYVDESEQQLLQVAGGRQRKMATSSYRRFLTPNADEMRMNGRIAEVL